MQSIKHPGVVPILDVFYGPMGSCLMVMRKASGGSLSQYRNLSENTINTFLVQLLATLNAIHRARILHRDLKPTNILVTSRHTIAITDFGLAARMPSQELQEKVGTPHYIAPEIVHGQLQTPAVDLWSLGVLLYELTSGTRPFIFRENENLQQYLRRIFPSHEQAPSIVRPQNITITDGLWNIISGLLQPRVASRLTIEGAIRHPYLNTRRDWLIERIGSTHPEWVRAIVQFYEDFLGVPRNIDNQTDQK
jgi:serine/threonine protein kinase